MNWYERLLADPYEGGGGGVERDQISDIRPPKNKYQTPKKSNIRYYVFAKNQRSDPQKNQLSDITSPKKKIKYQISRYPRSTPPPLDMNCDLWTVLIIELSNDMCVHVCTCVCVCMKSVLLLWLLYATKNGA